MTDITTTTYVGQHNDPQVQTYSIDTALYGEFASTSDLIGGVQENAEAGANLADSLTYMLNQINNAEDSKEKKIAKEMETVTSTEYPEVQTKFQQVSQKFQNEQSEMQSNLQSAQTPLTGSSQVVQTLMQIANAVSQLMSNLSTLIAASA